MSIRLGSTQFKEQYLGRITVEHLLNRVSNKKLDECFRIEKNQMEKIEDIKQLGNYKLVWYKNTNGKPLDWGDPGAISMSIGTDLELLKNRDGISSLIQSLGHGLTGDIEIISVHDETINETVIIDGVHRAISLFSIYTQSTEQINTILKSNFSLYEIKLTSKTAGLFFPFDFLNLY